MQSVTISSAYATRQSFAPTTQLRKQKIVAPRPFTFGTISLIAYLFVVHSYKVPLGFPAIALGIFAVLLQERPIRLTAPMFWYFLFLLWAVCTLPTSVAPQVSFNALQDSGKILLIMFVTANVIRTPAQHRVITLAWLGLFALYPVRGTLANFLSGNGDFGRYGWNFVFANFNDMAALTLIPLALSLERLRSTDKKWVKLCAGAGVIALPFIVLITQSRGGMLGLAAMLLYLVARSRYRKNLVVGLFAVGITAVLFAPPAVWERIRGMTYLTSVETLGQSDSSAEQRYLIYQVAKSIIADNPVTGVGIGAYSIQHSQYALKREEWAFAKGQRDAHNTYLRVTAESGFLGLALFLMIFASAYRELAKVSRNLKNNAAFAAKQMRDRCQAYQAAFIGLAVCAAFGSLESMVFPFMLIGLSSAALRLSNQPNLV
jgi:putative inorganic carbon (HCO3(-)) transporter